MEWQDVWPVPLGRSSLVISGELSAPSHHPRDAVERLTSIDIFFPANIVACQVFLEDVTRRPEGQAGLFIASPQRAQRDADQSDKQSERHYGQHRIGKDIHGKPRVSSPHT